MTVKIHRLPFKSLWNSEYTLFVNQSTGIVEKHYPDSLHLAKSYGRVRDASPDIAKIKAKELNNIISNQLHELDTERDTLITGIAAQVKTNGKLSMPAVAAHVVVLDHFFDQHGRDIAKANYFSETKRLDDLLADYDLKPEVKAASEGLNLDILFEQLRRVNTQFAELYLKRTEQDSAIEKVDVNALRTKTDKVLIDLFNAIEFCSSEYEDLDYTLLANELNDLITRYNTLLKARASRRNKGGDTGAEKPIE